MSAPQMFRSLRRSSKYISRLRPPQLTLSSRTGILASQRSQQLHQPQPTTIRQFTTTPKMASSKPFLDVVKGRRTYYALNKSLPISTDRIIEIVQQAVLHTPSSFNSQSARLVVLLNKDHDTFWEFVKEALKPLMPAEAYPATEKKLDGFKAGYGTILFFEDPTPVHALQKAFPLYADKFPQWSEHTSAMHQFVCWASLEAEGLGANLQHYNPVIDQKAQDYWKIPQEWSLKAQLVFGGRAGEPGPKEFKPLEERLFVHGK